MAILGLKNPHVPLESLYQSFHLNPDNIPVHVAMIMDGNGRWATKRFLPRTMGHKRGAESLREAIHTCVEFGIHYLSFYTFSTENWKRDPNEVAFLISLIQELLKKEVPKLHQKGARVKFLGQLSAFPEDLQAQMQQAEALMHANTTIHVNILINYGGRDEIVHACQQLNANNTPVTEESFAQHLYTRGIPDPDILIRTGGEHRISNYLLWQLAYTELFFIPTLWPDFSKKHFVNILRQFQSRNRRFGGVVS